MRYKFTKPNEQFGLKKLQRFLDLLEEHPGLEDKMIIGIRRKVKISTIGTTRFYLKIYGHQGTNNQTTEGGEVDDSGVREEGKNEE